MCGICGYTKSLGRDQDRSVIGQMKEYLRHRGPDGEGSYYSDDCVLGHRRLSIIDIDFGNQPMANEDGSVQVVFNGEIYNYRELWRELEGCGHRFTSDHSDTEVIVHGYEQWGGDLFQRLNGMFAIAIWDSRNMKLVLARDHLGVKPLYYSVQGESVIFSSEPKAILCHPRVMPEMNSLQLANYFFFRAPVHPDTLFKGVYKLSPGTCMVCNTHTGELHKREYWYPRCTDALKCDDSEIHERVNDQAVASVGAQLMSDVPLGIFLSGGVDSSLIAVAVGRNEKRADGFVVSTGGADDEGVWSRRVADALGMETNLRFVDGDEFLAYLDHWVYYNDDPVSDPSALALMMVSKYARESGKKVMLSGEGGDELFAGYNSYRRFLFYDKLKRYPLVPNMAARMIALAGRGNYRERDYMKLLKGRWAFAGTGHACSFDVLSDVIDPAVMPVETVLGMINRYGGNESAALDRACIFDQRVRLSNDLLPRTDRASMAVGLEVRVPLLDYTMVDLANGIPPEEKYMRGCLKRVLKGVLANYLPCNLVYRKKVGFDLPLAGWLRGNLAGMLRAYVERKSVSCLNYVSLGGMLDHFLQGKLNDYADFIWAYLLLEKWHERWCGSTLPQPRGLSLH